MVETMNLDCMEQEELMAFWRRATATAPIKTARELFPDRPRGYVTATRDMGHYACNKAVAMNCRVNGDIQAALVYEGICERIYNRLPEFAKW